MNAPDRASGRQIGPYQLDRVVGTGSFAAVHRAIDERLGDTVALKVLADNHTLDPAMRERFIAEGRALRRIDSPHVVRVLDVGETDQHQPYLVLEYADRGTLAERVASLRAQGWTPGPADVLAVARALAAAVAAIHAAGLVHRDLSPGNVLIRSTLAPQDHGQLLGDNDGHSHGRATQRSGDPHPATLLATDERLMLADLGLCKDLAVNSGFTQAAGTEGFRPPEQRAGPARIDARADLWALSALLAWLAAGAPPAGERAATMLKRTNLPESLGPVLDVSLAEDPEARHHDVAAWLADVEEALRPVPMGAHVAHAAHAGLGTAADGLPGTTSQLGPRTTGSRHTGRRRPALVGAVAGLVAGVVLGAGAAAVSGSDDGRRGELNRMENGDVEVVSEAGRARLAITGRSEVAVDEEAQLEAETTDVAHWVWLLPDGVVAFDQQTVTVRARSTGTARVTLLGVSISGDRLVVEHDLRVVDG